MKITKVTAFVWVLTFAGLAYGQDNGYRKLWISLSDGSNIEIGLSTTLETSFVKGDVVFTDKDIKYSFPKDQVKTFRFDKDPVSISSAKEADETYPMIDEGVIRFNQLPANSHITLTDMNGKVHVEATASGECTLTLPQLAQGVYVVKVNSMSYKVIIK